MKPYIYLFPLMVTILFLNACNKEDEELTKRNESNIVGEWTVISIESTNCTNDTNNGKANKVCSSTDCLSYIFSKDNGSTFIRRNLINGITINQSGTYDVDTDKVTFCMEEEEGKQCWKASLTLSSTNMTLTQTNSDTGCKEKISLEKN